MRFWVRKPKHVWPTEHCPGSGGSVEEHATFSGVMQYHGDVMEAGVASAATATSLTANTAPTTHATNDCAGQIIVANTNATWASGTVVYGLVLSNTSGVNAVFTVDKWYSLTSIGTTGTTPAATSNYVVLHEDSQLAAIARGDYDEQLDEIGRTLPKANHVDSETRAFVDRVWPREDSDLGDRLDELGS